MATEIHVSSPSQDTNSVLTSGANKFNQDKTEEDIGVSLSEDEDDDDVDESESLDNKDDEDRRIERIGDENPHLMAYLDHSDSNNSNAIASSSDEDFDDADLDDSRIEAEEEQAIRADFKPRPRTASIPGPVTLRRLSQSQHARTQNGADSDDSDSSDVVSENSSWGNDFLEDCFDLPAESQHSLHSRGSSNPNNRAKHGGSAAGSELEGQYDEDDDEGDENDEAYLWQYFFSSDENANDDSANSLSNPTFRARQRRLSRSKRNRNMQGASAPDSGSSGSTDEDLPLKGRGPLAPSQMNKAQPAGYVPSGDSTDEDDGVPPERKRRRARCVKAIEVLGSNSFSARPPILGSWRIKGDKNVGIIDGLTTRTLSPPAVQKPAPNAKPVSAQSSMYGESPQREQQGEAIDEPKDPFEGLGHDMDTLTDFADFWDSGFDDASTAQERKPDMDDSHLDGEVSDLDLLELGDFINTEALSSDENDGGHYEFNLVLDPQDEDSHSQSQQNQGQPSQPQKHYRSPLVSPYLYRNRNSGKNVPISAFRNRGSPYVSNVAYPTENFSPVPRRGSRRQSMNSRKPYYGRDLYLSPANHSRKKNKKSRLPNSSRGFLGNQSWGQEEGGENDFIGELIEIGAISPLFEIDQ